MKTYIDILWGDYSVCHTEEWTSGMDRSRGSNSIVRIFLSSLPLHSAFLCVALILYAISNSFLPHLRKTLPVALNLGILDQQMVRENIIFSFPSPSSFPGPVISFYVDLLT